MRPEGLEVSLQMVQDKVNATRFNSYWTETGERGLGRSDLGSMTPLHRFESPRELARDAIETGELLTDLSRFDLSDHLVALSVF